MKKTFRIVIVLGMLMALAVGVTASQAALLSYDSGIAVQNLEASTASITITFYNRDGSTALSVTNSIDPSSSNTYFPLQSIGNEDGSVPAGFDGSVVISSDKQVAAVTDIHGSNGSDPMAYNASYTGFNGGATSVNLPLLMKGNYGWNTWFSIQNVGSSPTDITVTYSDGVSANAVGVQPGAAAKFDQATEAHASGWVGSGSATSTGSDLAITSLEVAPNMLLAYDGFPSSGPLPIMPLVEANWFGYTTGIQIQNVGNTATQVTVSFTHSLSGSDCTEVRTIAAHASTTFGFKFTTFADPNPSTFVSTDCAVQSFVGSGSVTANTTNQDLNVIINQHDLRTGRNKGASYGGFDPSQGTATVIFPLITDRNYQYSTGWSVTNVGSTTIAAADLTCHVKGKDINGTTIELDFHPSSAIAPGQSYTQPNENTIGNRFVGSGTCTGPAGSQMVGIVNYLKNTGSADSFLTYEAVNQ